MIQQINHLNLEQEIGLKQMTHQQERIAKIIKLNLKLQ